MKKILCLMLAGALMTAGTGTVPASENNDTDSKPNGYIQGLDPIDITISIPEINNDADSEALGIIQGITFDDSAGDFDFDLSDSLSKINSLSGSDLSNDAGKLKIYLGFPLHKTTDQGAVTETDLTQTIGSRVISAPLNLKWGDASISVRVTNPYEKDAPLSECFVSYASCENTGTAYETLLNTYVIGEGVMDDLSEELRESAYRKEDSRLIFKTSPSLMIKSLDISFPYGEQILKEEDFSMELSFDYDDGGVLSAVTMISPAYLYNGLEDNVASEDLETLDAGQLQSAASLRDDILGKLSAAFDAAGVAVDTDQRKGTIRMANDVLFDVNEYELTDAGKDYIDKFIGVYASVLLGDEFGDKIRSIEIEGHTDTNGTFEENQVLSDKRAESVYNYCCESPVLDDVQKSQFAELADKRGFSFSDPVFTSDGDVDMDASRRVEIKFRVKT